MTRASTTKPKKRAAKKKEELVVLEKETLSPLRDLFELYYLDPLSPSFGKVMPSAIKAGFKESYAKNLTVENPRWLQEITGKSEFRDKARRNLNKHLDLKTTKSKFGQDVEDAHLLEIQQKATFFVLEKLDENFKKDDKQQKGGDTVLNKLEFHINFPVGFVPPVTQYREAEVISSVIRTDDDVINTDYQQEDSMPKRFRNGREITGEHMEDDRLLDERKPMPTVEKLPPRKNIKKMLKEILES